MSIPPLSVFMSAVALCALLPQAAAAADVSARSQADERYAVGVGLTAQPQGVVGVPFGGVGVGVLGAPGGLGGLGGVGGLAGGAPGSPSLAATVERRLSRRHWLGVTLEFAYAAADASSPTGAGAGSGLPAAETSSESLGTTAGLTWRYVFNPGDRVELGSFVQASYRLQQSDSWAALSNADGEIEQTTVHSRAHTAALSGGANLDANLSDNLGLRVAVTLAEAAWSQQEMGVDGDPGGGVASDRSSSAISAGLKLVPSLALRVRF